MQTNSCRLPRWLLPFVLLIPILVVGCDNPGVRKQDPSEAEQNEQEAAADGKAASGGQGSGRGGQSMAASPFGSPKDTISHQYVLLRAGAVEELRRLFTEDVRDQITQEMVDELRKSMGPVSLRELVSEVEEQEIDGKPAAVIKRRDGSKLTTLIKNGDLWQADTIWFK